MAPALSSLPPAFPQGVPGQPLIRCAPAIKLIAQTSFPKAAEPFRGRVLIPHTGDNPPGQGCSGSNAGPVPAASASVQGHPVLCRDTRSVPRGWHPPGSSGEPRAFPASLAEITREKWDGKLLMRPSQGVGSAWGPRKGLGVERVCSCPLCWRRSSPQHPPRSVSVSPQGPEEQPDQHSPARRLPRPPRAETPVSAGGAPWTTWGWPWGQQRGQWGILSPDGPSTHLAGTSPTTASAA